MVLNPYKIKQCHCSSSSASKMVDGSDLLPGYWGRKRRLLIVLMRGYLPRWGNLALRNCRSGRVNG